MNLDEKRKEAAQTLCLSPPNSLFAKGCFLVLTTNPHPASDHPGLAGPVRSPPPVLILTITSLVLAHVELTNATFHSQTRPHPNLAPTFPQDTHLASHTLNWPGRPACSRLSSHTFPRKRHQQRCLRFLSLHMPCPVGASSQAGTWQREGEDKLPSKLQMQQLKRGQRQ